MARDYDLLRSSDGMPVFKPGMTADEKVELLFDYILRIKEQCGMELDIVKRGTGST